MNALDAAIKHLERFVLARLDEHRAYRGVVVGQSNGMVQIRPLDAESGQTALRARVAGFTLVNDDEVLYVKVNKLPVIIGKIQRAAADDFELDASLEVPALTINGVPVTGSSALTIKDDGVSVDTDITTIDFLSPLTVSESPENEVNIDVDVGTGASQVAAGDHNHDADYADISHNHDADYADISHTHAAADVFVPIKGVNANPGLATASTWGMPAALLNATASNDDDATGPYVAHQTGAVSGNATSMRDASMSPASTLQRAWNPEIEIVAKPGATISSIRIWVGVFSGIPNSSADPAEHGAAFRFDTSAGDGGNGNWRAWTNDGSGGGTITDTGVDCTGDVGQVFKIIMNASEVEFYIDGLLVATHTTNLPGSTTMLGYNVSCSTLTSAARVVSWSRVRIAHGPYEAVG